MFKGGDEISDVWHALDDSTEKVVTLEILRDRANDAARQRFLAEAQRMAAIERPSVMRVAAIHNEATDTFIVFEHLIPLPVVLTELSAIAKDTKPATTAAEDRAAMTPRETLQVVSSSLSSARSELSGFAQGVIADVREIAGLDELVLAARSRIPRSLDASPLTSLAASITARVTALTARVTVLTSRVAAPVRSFVRVAGQLVAPLRSLRSAASQARPSSSRAAD